MNGGVIGGILAAIGRENLSPEDQTRLDYLNSLPKNKWITLGDDGKAISPEEAERQFKKHLFNNFTIIRQPEPDFIDFVINETHVIAEHESGTVEKFWITDFFDALPDAPKRGTAVIETRFYGKMETECAIHVIEIRDPYTGEYEDRTQFIPLGVYLRELVSVEDMETAYKTLKSLTA